MEGFAVVSSVFGIILMASAIVLAWYLVAFIRGLQSKLDGALGSLQATLSNVQRVSQEVAGSGILAKAKTTMSSVESGVGQIEPLLTQLQTTLAEARLLLDDATQTSQSVRARVDDLAAMQRELQDTSAALADVMTQIRDQRIAGKLGNVLSDTSMLMADIGMLTENANAVLEGGRPLVENIGSVVESAKKGVKTISSAARGIKEGVSTAVDTLKDRGPENGHPGA